MMSDFENMDVILGNESTILNERELSDVIGNSENHCDIESGSQFRVNLSQEINEQYGHERRIPRQDVSLETMETFTSEFNMRFSQEMDSMMSMTHTQINRAITSAIAERVIPEIQNMLALHTLQEIGTRSVVCPQTVRKLEETQPGLNQKLQKRIVGLQLI